MLKNKYKTTQMYSIPLLNYLKTMLKHLHRQRRIYKSKELISQNHKLQREAQLQEIIFDMLTLLLLLDQVAFSNHLQVLWVIIERIKLSQFQFLQRKNQDTNKLVLNRDMILLSQQIKLKIYPTLFKMLI